MLKLCRVDIRRSQEIFRKIDDYVDEVVHKLDPSLIILFGSFATNDINEGSDVDILVVADFKESFLDRIRVLMDLNKIGLPIEPIGYTPAEFEKTKRRENPFIMEVVEKGKVLFDASLSFRFRAGSDDT